MKNIYFIIFFLLFSKIFTKSGGRSSGGGRRSGGSSSKNRKGSLRNSKSIRFTSSGRYGRSRLWFSNHYVNIHYIGHRNYYEEEEYSEEDYYNINEDIYLIYVINGTFLKKYLKNSNYENFGHYITFSEYSALSDFLANMTEFHNIFGNDTKIIMSTNYLNKYYINNTIVDFIDENSYQKIMIDVITDVHYVPFYKLFPNFHVSIFLFYLSKIFLFLFLFCSFFLYSKFGQLKSDKYFIFIYLLTTILFIYFIIAINSDFNIRKNYMIFLSKHFFNSLFYFLWQILQLYFTVHLLFFINDENENRNQFISKTFYFFVFLIVIEYNFEFSPGFITIFIALLKVAFFLYSLYLLYNFKHSNQYLFQQNPYNVEKYNESLVIIILMIKFEFLILFDNGLIFYIIQFVFYLILVDLFFFNSIIRKIDNDTIEDDKTLFLNKN